MPAVDARAVALLKDLGQMGDEIIEDAATAKTGNDIRLEKDDQGQIKVLFVLLLGEGYVVYGGIYSRIEPK